MPKPKFFHAICLVLIALLSSPASAQIYKCPDASGRTVIQQLPCTDGQILNIKPASGPGTNSNSSPANTQENPPAENPPTPAPVPALPPPVPVIATPPTASQLEQDAELCLDWYRPFLLDPRGAYYTAPVRDKRTVKITIHATTRGGGVSTLPARCEIVGGKLDQSWTEYRAKEDRWIKR